MREEGGVSPSVLVPVPFVPVHLHVRQGFVQPLQVSVILCSWFMNEDFWLARWWKWCPFSSLFLVIAQTINDMLAAVTCVQDKSWEKNTGEISRNITKHHKRVKPSAFIRLKCLVSETIPWSLTGQAVRHVPPSAAEYLSRMLLDVVIMQLTSMFWEGNFNMAPLTVRVDVLQQNPELDRASLSVHLVSVKSMCLWAKQLSCNHAARLVPGMLASVKWKLLLAVLASSAEAGIYCCFSQPLCFCFFKLLGNLLCLLLDSF